MGQIKIGISPHHGSPGTPRTSQSYGTKGFEGGSHLKKKERGKKGRREKRVEVRVEVNLTNFS